MINGIISSPFLAGIAQNTSASVTVETVLKSIGRPGFILIDKDIDGGTKQYAAAKEFLYQMTCLAVYLAIITPIFKKGAFKLGKKFYKGAEGFDKFKTMKEYNIYHSLAVRNLKDRRAILASHSFGPKKELLAKNGHIKQLWTKEKPEKYDKIKGTIELGSLIGSVLGLAILAPEISHHTIHPMLKWLGLEKKQGIDTKI